MTDPVQRAATDDDSFWRLIDARREPIGSFLAWAADCEDGGESTSLRFDNRGDMRRCSEVLELFDEPWWGVVVYSCFDSTIGSRAVADVFATPIPPEAAESELSAIEFPPGSVQHHRAQSTLTGAKRSLASACGKAEVLQAILVDTGASFEDRFGRLMAQRPVWWGRTTCFDALARAGVLQVSGTGYRPQKAHLAGSTGPAAGFAALFGVDVTKANADACEHILRRWTDRWDVVADRVGEAWDGTPYDSADFENALCIFQEPPHSGLPDPQDYRATRGSGPAPRL